MLITRIHHLARSRSAAVAIGALLLVPSAFALPAVGAAVGAAGGPAGTGPARSGELLVVFEQGATRAAAHRAAEADAPRRLEHSGVEVVTVDDVDAALDEYRSRPDVRFAEVNGTVVAAAAPNDELYNRQWYLQPVTVANKGTANAETAWNTATGTGVVVAVLDTGVRPGGGDLEASRLMTGYDFVNNDTNADDDDGHGTHVAGSIAQSTNNTQGIAGMAPRAKILPGKILDANGGGDYATVIEGLVWATAQGAKVINLSLVGTTSSAALCDAVTTAAASAVVVAATGNAASGTVGYPAACPAALAVGAVRYDGQKAAYSNFGPGIDIVAPGGDANVDQNGDGQKDLIIQQSFYFLLGSIRVWEWQDRVGTSMATGHVSGAAALIEGLNPASDTRAVLLSTARDLGIAGADDTFGSGALDAGAAVASVPATNPSPLGVSGPATTTTTGPTPAPPAPPGPGPVPPTPPPSPTGSYRFVGRDGGIFSFGGAKFFGSMGGKSLSASIVGMASTPSGNGYWLVGSDGGIFSFGDAKFFGSMGAKKLSAPIVGMAATSTGKGYWFVGADGGIFSFGDAKFFGSMGGKKLSAPIVGMS